MADKEDPTDAVDVREVMRQRAADSPRRIPPPAAATTVDGRTLPNLEAVRAEPDPRDSVPPASSTRFLKRIPEADRQLILASGEHLSFGFGQPIVREGEPSDGLYFLLEGRARVVTKSGGAQETALAILSAGDVFGEIAKQGATRSATVRSSGQVEVLRLSAEALDKVLAQRPHIRGWLAGYAESRTLATLLRNQSIFGKLDEHALEGLVEGLVPVSIPAGQLIFREGDELGPMYIVKSGKLKVSKATRGGPLPIAYLREGSAFGISSSRDQSPRKATVEALTDVTLLALANKPFRGLFQSSPEFKSTVEEHLGSIEWDREAPLPLDIAELPRVEAKKRAEAAAPRSTSTPGANRAGEDTEKPRPGEIMAPTDEAPYKSADGYFVKKKGKRSFPFAWQVDEMDCGVACLAMICRYYGKRVSLGRIRTLANAGIDGTSLASICRAASELGLAARSARVSVGNLDKLPLPAVVHWQNYHWVVLVEVKKDKVRVADPAVGDHWITRAEFLESWNGWSALLDFTDQFRNTSEDKPSLAWLSAYFRPYLGVFFTAVGLSFVTAALTMVLPVLSQIVVDRVVVDGAKDLLSIVLATMGATFAILIVSRILEGYLLAYVAVRVDAALLDYLARRLLALPMKYFGQRRTGDIQRRIEGARGIRELIVSSGISGLLALVQFTVALAIMMVYSPTLTLVFLAMAPLYAGLMIFSAKVLNPLFASLEENFGRYQSDQLDAIKGMESVKAASAEATFRDALLDRFLRTTRQQFRADYAILTYEGALQGVGYLSSIAFLWMGAQLAIKGEITLGGFVAFNSLVAMANQPIFSMLGLWDKAQRGQVLMNRLSDVFETEPEQGRDRANLIPVRTLAGGVELRGVGFRYGGPESTPILRNIDLKVAPGEMVAFVGRSGSGKTTLVKVITGLLEATEGTVLFDGVDARMLNHRDLRRRVGFVLQENHMFSGTILENVAFGEEPDLERAVAAARAADAHGFISHLPLGYGTMIGESGVRLSGGQAQRIAIARALYKQPTLFIFDEATSALDTESERIIQNNLANFFHGRTAFVIAHRLSTVRDADRIVVLERGEIVEIGNHQQLMKRRGIYYELASKQVEQ